MVSKTKVTEHLAVELGGVTKNEAHRIVTQIFAHITATLQDRKRVQIRKFGSFQISERGERAGYDPRARKVISIPAKTTVTFRPSRALKGRISAASGCKKVGTRSIFISYSHLDRKWLERLKIMLKPRIREGDLSLWDDSKIRPGASWRSEIGCALGEAKIAILLVSANFLASDFIVENELPRLLEGAKRRGVVIIWLLLSECLYERTAINEYQATHDLKYPLDTLSEAAQNGVLARTCRKICEAAE